MPRGAIGRVIFDGDVVRKMVSDPRITWKDKYLTRKTSALQWLNSAANTPGFKGFAAEPFYNNAWQGIWAQGTLPPSYTALDAAYKTKLDVYLTIANEIAQDALAITSTGVAISVALAGKKADFVFRRSGLRAWIIGKQGDKVRLKMETGAVSDWHLLSEIEKDVKRV